MQVQLRHMMRAREGCLYLVTIAHAQGKADIVGRFVIDEGRAVFHGVFRHDDGGQFGVFDGDQIRCVAGLGLGFGDHNRNSFAYKTNAIDSQRHVHGAVSRRTAHVFGHDTAGGAHTVRDVVRAGEHRKNTRCVLSLGGVDPVRSACAWDE